MRALVTGAAGFIGSTLTERLVSLGWEVVGLDSLTDYYSRAQKIENLEGLTVNPNFVFHEDDLATCDIQTLLSGVTHVFHQAGQPGVRGSWGTGFGEYVEQNILATQRLLEAATAAPVQRFVYASSSSIYGNATAHPTLETALPQPVSPYGVTKLAAEHLCGAYAKNYGVPTVSLRYFTVYGPRQRPDMAIHRLIEAALHGRQFTVFGDGSKVRDFTFVGDVVEANVLAATIDSPAGSIFNVAGGSEISMKGLFEMVERATGRKIPMVQQPDAPGDAERTGGSTDLISSVLGWTPTTSLAEGIQVQTEWHKTSKAVADA